MSNVQISQLSTVTSVAAGDLVPLASASLGVTAKASMSQILTYIESNFADPSYTVTRSAPVTGFSQVVSGTTNVWLIWSPAGTLATGTLTLPVAADCFDGQVVLVTTSQIITALTVTAGAGTSVVGAPSTLAAGGFFALRYNTLNLTWYCVASSLGLSGQFANLTLSGDILDSNGNELINFTSTASAVNEVAITNAATGNPPVIAATGGDTNIPLTLTSKGSGAVQITSPTGAVNVDGATFDVDATGAIDIESSAGNVGLVATTAVATVQGATAVNVIATAGTVTISAVGAGTDVVLSADDDVSASAVGDIFLLTNNSIITTQGDPADLNATGTLTAAKILTHIVTSTTGAAVVATVDTGTAMEAVFANLGTGGSIKWDVINTGANSFTVTAAAGHTLVGNGIVVTVSSGNFITRRTALNTFITYRTG